MGKIKDFFLEMGKKILMVGVVLCVLVGALIVSCETEAESASDGEAAKKRIARYTEIEVPTEANVVYHYYKAEFVNGRRGQYTVFEFADQPTEWLKQHSFSSEKDTDYEDYFLYNDFGLLDSYFSKEIPEEYMPNFDKQYSWIEKARVYFLYYPEDLRLIVYVKAS